MPRRAPRLTCIRKRLTNLNWRRRETLHWLLQAPQRISQITPKRIFAVPSSRIIMCAPKLVLQRPAIASRKCVLTQKACRRVQSLCRSESLFSRPGNSETTRGVVCRTCHLYLKGCRVLIKSLLSDGVESSSRHRVFLAIVFEREAESTTDPVYP